MDSIQTCFSLILIIFLFTTVTNASTTINRVPGGQRRDGDQFKFGFPTPLGPSGGGDSSFVVPPPLDKDSPLSNSFSSFSNFGSKFPSTGLSPPDVNFNPLITGGFNNNGPSANPTIQGQTVPSSMTLQNAAYTGPTAPTMSQAMAQLMNLASGNSTATPPPSTATKIPKKKFRSKVLLALGLMTLGVVWVLLRNSYFIYAYPIVGTYRQLHSSGKRIHSSVADALGYPNGIRLVHRILSFIDELPDFT